MSALLAAAVLWWLLRPFRVAVEGWSMAPTLQPGDFLVAVRAKRPRPGSLVVVEHPGRAGFELVKRLDLVLGIERGRPDGYWVVGDASDTSTDSRTFGPVLGSAIKGVVVGRYWPPSRVALLLG